MKNLSTLFITSISFILVIGCNSNSSESTSIQKEDSIQRMDPNDILMTIPTIENTIPSTSQTTVDSINLEITEDDWRQVEFISTDFIVQINQEIDSINNIFTTQSIATISQFIRFWNSSKK